MKRIVTTRIWDHIESNEFWWTAKEVTKRACKFCENFKHELVSIIRVY